MRYLGTLLLLSSLCFSPGPAGSPQEHPSGEEVMRRVNQRERSSGSSMLLKLTLKDASRGDHERLIELKRIKTPQGYRSRFRILQPGHLEGIGLLLIEEGRQSSMWMYFPASNHLVKVASRGLSALASDFSCEDLRTTFPLQDYRFSNLGRAPCGDASCFKIEMIPRQDRLKRELGFSRAVGWIDQTSWQVLRAEYFDSQQRHYKTFLAQPPRVTEGIATIPSYEMRNLRVEHTTHVEVLQADHHLEPEVELYEPSGLSGAAAATPQQQR